jgi:type VI secretion system protein ImpE
VTAEELLKAGHLSAAVEQLNQEVRSRPTDIRRRTFLFELLCFTGDCQRAERQLDVLGQQRATAEIGVQVYRHILTAEQVRQRLFSEGMQPNFLFPPPSYVHLHLEALYQLCNHQPAEAVALLDQSQRSQPPLKGSLAGQPFTEWRDGDDLLAPFLEVIVHNTYVWLPFEQIKRLHIPTPKRLRDLLWAPATLEAHSGPVGEVFLPVLYADSHRHADERVKLGRMTDWLDLGAGLVRGVGQRLFFSDGQERAMLEVRELIFTTAAPTAPDDQ